MTRRQRDCSKLLHIIILPLNHRLGATLAAAQAACQCLNLHPFLSWLHIRMVVLVCFLRRKKKKRVRKREFSLYCFCKTCPGHSVIGTGRFNCIISRCFYFTDLLIYLQIIYRYRIFFKCFSSSGCT